MHNSGNPDVTTESFASARRAMMEDQIRKRGISSPAVLGAMLHVPRHEFVPAAFQADAYADKPLPIGDGQTISQPYMVAAMTEALELSGSERVLEIGAGSGYQAAVFSLLVSEVFSVESHTLLALAARERLARMGYANVHIHNGTARWVFRTPLPTMPSSSPLPRRTFLRRSQTSCARAHDW